MFNTNVVTHLRSTMKRIRPEKQSGDRFGIFVLCLSAVIVMNVLDGLLTVFWVSTNMAVEANPLMEHVLNIHPALFMSVKIALVYLGAFILLRHSERIIANLSVVIAFCAYWMVLLYHCTMLFALRPHII